ncbi:hypothetical protein IWX47DRAFT_468306 [Phyllosticta citricarpa]
MQCDTTRLYLVSGNAVPGHKLLDGLGGQRTMAILPSVWPRRCSALLIHAWRYRQDDQVEARASCQDGQNVTTRLDATLTRNNRGMRDRAVLLSRECLKCGRPGRLLARLGFVECCEASLGLATMASGARLRKAKDLSVLLGILEPWDNPTASRENERDAGIARQRMSMAGVVEFALCAPPWAENCGIGVSKGRDVGWLWNGSGAFWWTSR